MQRLAALVPRRSGAMSARCGRNTRFDAPGEAERLAGLLRPLVEAAARDVLVSLYPATRADNPPE